MRAVYFLLAAATLSCVSCKSKHHSVQSVNTETEYTAAISKNIVDSNAVNINISRHIDLEYPEIALLDTVTGVKATIKCRRITVGSNSSGNAERLIVNATDSIASADTASIARSEKESESSPPSAWKFIVLIAMAAAVIPVLKILLKHVVKNVYG